MTMPRIQSFTSLRDEMIAVARGERKAPEHAGQPSVHSADVIARLLTRENRELMSVIRDERPESIAKLAEITHRASSNLTRTLEKLAAVGLVSFEIVGRRKAPRTTADKIVIEIDPFSSDDRIRITTTSQPARSRRQSITHGKGSLKVGSAKRSPELTGPKTARSQRPVAAKR